MSEPPGSQAELQRLRRELEAARDALGEFAYVVTHDLRAPLRHILAYSDLLREELGPRLQGEAAQFLETIGGAARLLARQIDGLKAWAQLGRVQLQPTVVDAAALLAELRQQLQPQASGRAVQWDIATDLPALRGDAALLRELFAQLLDNALKFTAPRALAQIAVRALPAAAADMVTIEVRDNGVGYNPAQQERLFRVFQRLHGSAFQGLGLGLAMAQRIAQRHGGAIAIEGAPDAGCRVCVTLPRAG